MLDAIYEQQKVTWSKIDVWVKSSSFYIKQNIPGVKKPLHFAVNSLLYSKKHLQTVWNELSRNGDYVFCAK